MTFNQLVAGSNPARPTIISRIPGRLAQLGEHLPYKEGVTGSIPVTTTIFASEAEISATFAEKVPIQMGIFFARNSVLQLLLLPLWRAERHLFYCATLPLCHSATLPLCHSVISHILYSALPRLPDCTPVHRDAAYMNACNKVNASNKKGRPRPARKDAQGAT
ncbi:hypothetical protein AERO8C_50148 [Aeromonas veronii]|uniref:Uncharacterized protein n=1 Tax=Aeromonas veronii TaxID=654 RepID=A0A653L8I7_AERVE|nr:hypothetical protein AERO8C_50148 [Aeromonas veronii]